MRTGIAMIFLFGGAPGLGSVVHMFEAIACSWGSVSAPEVGIVMGVAPE